MNDTRIAQMVACFDEARTIAAELLDELPGRSEEGRSIAFARRNANLAIGFLNPLLPKDIA